MSVSMATYELREKLLIYPDPQPRRLPAVSENVISIRRAVMRFSGSFIVLTTKFKPCPRFKSANRLSNLIQGPGEGRTTTGRGRGRGPPGRNLLPTRLGSALGLSLAGSKCVSHNATRPTIAFYFPRLNSWVRPKPNHNRPTIAFYFPRLNCLGSAGRSYAPLEVRRTAGENATPRQPRPG